MTKKLIQLITNNSNISMFGEYLEVNTLSKPKSLDEFQITIIDLNKESIWISDSKDCKSVNCEKDLQHLARMIGLSKRTKIVFLYPQNYNFMYNPSISSEGKIYKYKSNIELKNILSNIEDNIFNYIFSIPVQKLEYENTETKILNNKLEASFYFHKPIESITKSDSSEKTTTSIYEGMVLTTLKIEKYKSLIDFLRYVEFIELKEEIPDWILSLDMFDDKYQKEIIKNKEEEITEADECIKHAKNIIEKNNEYKSILYTNGDQLVDVVFDILEQLLNCNLSNFKDEHNEDFIVRFEDITFIGEIKGVTSNVKSEHISQLDVHLQGYFDKLEEDNESEKVKSILIINHQRNKNKSERVEVNKTQINLAKRNESLIIETITLLEIFEKYKNGKLDTSKIKKLLSEETGLLKL